MFPVPLTCCCCLYLSQLASSVIDASGRKEASGWKEDPTKEKNVCLYILKVVVLLIDPVTRRFDLLPMEFDSLKALVSDVLAEIPVSFTEANHRRGRSRRLSQHPFALILNRQLHRWACLVRPQPRQKINLRLQTFTGLVGKDGVEMAPTKLLATFCEGNDILVAIPDGIPAKESARLARPILSDKKVISMVRFLL
jgi:hypothetical protein